MTVQATVPSAAVPSAALPSAAVPRQAEPVEPPPAPAPSPLLGRDRPLTVDERQFALGLAALVLVLGTIIVGGLLLGQYAWS